MFGMNIGRGGSCRSETGSHWCAGVNSKHEIRNTKQIQNANVQMTKTTSVVAGQHD